MQADAIFALIAKGLTLLPLLIDGGKSIVSTIENLKKLANAGATGEVPDVDLVALEADFDAKLAEFNSDIPE